MGSPHAASRIAADRVRRSLEAQPALPGLLRTAFGARRQRLLTSHLKHNISVSGCNAYLRMTSCRRPLARCARAQALVAPTLADAGGAQIPTKFCKNRGN